MFKVFICIILVNFFVKTNNEPLSSLITYKDQMCLPSINKVCLACTLSLDESEKCLKIDTEMKTVIFSGKKFAIDYDSYVNSGVKMINEDDTITMYSCNVNDTYIQVTPSIFYPTDRKLRYPKYHVVIHDNVTVTPFQDCLNKFCLIHINFLKCVNQSIDQFDFNFNKHVTLQCVQNITIALISTLKLTSITYNNLFYYASNLIYLRLHVHNLFHFDCYTFQGLRNLRILEFMTKSVSINKYECVFKYNPNLIKIQVGNFSIWRTCEPIVMETVTIHVTTTTQLHWEPTTVFLDTKPTTKDRPVSLFTILLLLLLIILLITCYIQKKNLATNFE